MFTQTYNIPWLLSLNTCRWRRVFIAMLLFAKQKVLADIIVGCWYDDTISSVKENNRHRKWNAWRHRNKFIILFQQHAFNLIPFSLQLIFCASKPKLSFHWFLPLTSKAMAPARGWASKMLTPSLVGLAVLWEKKKIDRIKFLLVLLLLIDFFQSVMVNQ